jgi:hypothetical protein
MRTLSCAVLAATLALALSSPAESTELLDDSWFRLTVGGAHVGHAHRTVEAGADGSTVTRVSTAMEVRRLGRVMGLASDEEWLETAEGHPIAYDLVRKMGAEEVRLRVRVGDGLLTVEKSAGGGTFRDTLQLGGRLLFPEGQRHHHASRGFRPGDRYSYLVFDPDFEAVTRVEAVVADDGSRSPPWSAVLDRPGAAGDSLTLHRLAVTSELYDGIEFFTWLDGGGRVWREEVPSLGLTSQVTTRESAVHVDEVIDIVVETMIKTNVRVGNPRAVDGALYEVWVEGDDVAAFLPEDRRQVFEATTDRGALLRVRRVVPGADAAEVGAITPGPAGEYTEENALLQVSDPLVRTAAVEAVGEGASGAWESARRIERYVFDTMEEVGFGSAFASAVEVLQHRSGDCSEHAVLAAAMARAVGVPSRVVSGLVHVDGRFAYHMWFEVWVGGSWYALDPTIGAGSVDATHIKLADSSLAGGAVGELSVAVMRAMGGLRVEVVEYEDGGRVVRAGGSD